MQSLSLIRATELSNKQCSNILQGMFIFCFACGPCRICSLFRLGCPFFPLVGGPGAPWPPVGPHRLQVDAASRCLGQRAQQRKDFLL